ncbi:ribosomal RNA-processing protein 7 homolog A-like isoform X2 [Branchiostoma floridae x Branchiostoma belcheri]
MKKTTASKTSEEPDSFVELCGEFSVGGFSAVPVKFGPGCRACQLLYFKPHQVRGTDDSRPADRTLFVLNVPPYCTKDCLNRLFSRCGKVEAVYFCERPGGQIHTTDDTSKFFPRSLEIRTFKVAYVVFEKPSGLRKAAGLKLSEPFVLSTRDQPVVTGMKKWCQKYTQDRPDVAELQSELDSYMADYDKRKQEELEKEKAQGEEPDEEGWITVTRHGRTPGAPRTEAMEKKALKREKKKRSRRELMNFYTFQIRESKREHIAQLRKKFEEDKDKIAAMKANRRFRPY